MREKKQQEGGGDLSPTFLARAKQAEVVSADKVFSGVGNIKSRKIAISSIDGNKRFAKDEASPNQFDEGVTYKKSEIMLENIGAEYKDSEKTRSQEQREKLEMWSDEQRGLKEEVKKVMREEIEKAERAKKEEIKEKMLEEERQKEIMRIREEVRLQIKKEIQAEIDQQRKQVLQDPELKSQIMELEALKQSAVKSTDIKPVTSTPEGPTDSFTVQQDQHKKDMNQWLEKHGKRASEMNVEEMRRMQTMYMQQLHHWSQQQQKAYMQWYWHQQQNYKQHYFSQKSGFYNSHPTSGAGDQKAPVSGPDSQQRGPNQSHMVSNLPPGVRPPLDQGQHPMSSMHQRPPDGQNIGNPTFTR
uniref:Uncharacterized protein n=2 Tax=Ciona intestinalis TaxID=7719 RepID=F6Y6F9_CIOIN